jgi:Asp-tRNA(Asn)/Glu-tRNA(Gln) amidotransferase A subunit family amidase
MLTHLDIPDVIEGVPCAIQIMGRNLKDEDLLAHAKVVEDVLRS